MNDGPDTCAPTARKLDLAGPFILPTLANAPAGKGQRLFAAVVCAGFMMLSLLLLPSLTQPMPTMLSFLAINQSALIFVYDLTTWLLFVQFRRTRSVSLLVLGAGSLYITLIVTVQLVSFPNMFASGLAFGQGAQTLTWLWNFWHLAPSLFALPYAILEHDPRPPLVSYQRVIWTIIGTVAAVCAGGALTTIIVLHHDSDLPNILDTDGGY